jgi:hypothetical protein
MKKLDVSLSRQLYYVLYENKNYYDLKIWRLIFVQTTLKYNWKTNFFLFLIKILFISKTEITKISYFGQPISDNHSNILMCTAK